MHKLKTDNSAGMALLGGKCMWPKGQFVMGKDPEKVGIRSESYVRISTHSLLESSGFHVIFVCQLCDIPNFH